MTRTHFYEDIITWPGAPHNAESASIMTYCCKVADIDAMGVFAFLARQRL